MVFNLNDKMRTLNREYKIGSISFYFNLSAVLYRY